jgi:hypothetical protein
MNPFIPDALWNVKTLFTLAFPSPKVYRQTSRTCQPGNRKEADTPSSSLLRNSCGGFKNIVEIHRYCNCNKEEETGQVKYQVSRERSLSQLEFKCQKLWL